jgi:hypothetical protein
MGLDGQREYDVKLMRFGMRVARLTCRAVHGGNGKDDIKYEAVIVDEELYKRWRWHRRRKHL